LEVAWFSDNRLSRIENLDNNFRIKELYAENNRLVSLAGAKNFKFLRVLMVGNNQLRNLDKQLALLSRFAFLKKLDLFDNPVAEEPDYRLRVIYHVPQVEVLDRHAVKPEERMRAAEVVPNLDKVSAAQPEKMRRKAPWADHSEIEKHCFRTAKDIAVRRKRAEDEALSQTFARGVDEKANFPQPRTLADLRGSRHMLKSLDHGNGCHQGAYAAHDPLDDIFARRLAESDLKDDFKQEVEARNALPGRTDSLTKLLGSSLQQTGDATIRPEPFKHTLKKHMADPATKARGDVFHQSFLKPRRELDDSTGRHCLKVGHSGRLTAIGG